MATPYRNESYLVYEVLKALNSGHGQYGKFVRVNTGSVKTASGSWFSTGTPKGYPDISGHIKGGKAVYIECKVDGNKPTEAQRKWIDEARADGALANVCYSVEDALRLIGVLPDKGA